MYRLSSTVGTSLPGLTRQSMMTRGEFSVCFRNSGPALRAPKTRVNALMARPEMTRVTIRNLNCGYPRPPNRAYLAHASLNRGLRRSRRSRRSGVGVPTTRTRWSAGRRRAFAQKGPRAPGPPSPRYTWVPESWRETPASQAGEGSLASSLAPPGALHPLVFEGKGNRDTGTPAARMP